MYIYTLNAIHLLIYYYYLIKPLKAKQRYHVIKLSSQALT